MAPSREIRLFNTDEHSCSYLPEQQARLQFVDPELELTDTWRTILSDNGFRRSGAHYYRPQCGNCSACTPLRVRVTDFTPSRSQRRCLKRNSDLTIRIRTANKVDIEGYYPLFARYIESRHGDGDMFPPSRDQFDGFIGTWPGTCSFIEFYLGSRLLMVAQTDQLNNGLSSVYTFFEPLEQQRGLGTFAILQQIELANKLGLEFLFLGYWIAASGKMSYKQKFKPCEVFVDGRWQRL